MSNIETDPTPETRTFQEELYQLRHRIENKIIELIPEDEVVELSTRLVYEEAQFDADNNACIEAVTEYGVVVRQDSTPDWEHRVNFLYLDTELLLEVLKGVELAKNSLTSAR